MKWDDLHEDTQSLYRAIAVVVAGLLLLAGVVLLGGCRSACTEVVCPPIVPPKVVEVPVRDAPSPLPVPRPPRLLLPTVDETDVDAVLDAIAHDLVELRRACAEAWRIIETHNKEVSDDG